MAYSQKELKEIIAEVDKFGDNHISKEEFEAAMRLDFKNLLQQT